jgi:hypothetical protein
MHRGLSQAGPPSAKEDISNSERNGHTRGCYVLGIERERTWCSDAAPFSVACSLEPVRAAGARGQDFQGALVASMRIPWVETKGHGDLGSYQELDEVAAPIREHRSDYNPHLRR